jgi:hypothetical protein
MFSGYTKEAGKHHKEVTIHDKQKDGSGTEQAGQ